MNNTATAKIANSPRITVIVPVYNVEPYIERCFDSIAMQKYDNLEVIFIDDCGTDRSVEILTDKLNGYSGNIEFKLLHHTVNNGQSAGRNNGIRNATGDYILFVDSDDCLQDNAIQGLAKAIEENPGFDVYIANRDIIEQGTNKILHQVSSRKPYIVKMYSLQDALNHGVNGEPFNKLVNRQFLLEHNLFFHEGIVFEDNSWVFELLCQSPTILYTPIVIYTYWVRPNSNSTMGSFKEHHFYSYIKTAVLAFQYFDEVPQANKWYALSVAEQFKARALANVIDRLPTENNYALFRETYYLFRALKMRRFSFFFKKKISLKARLRYITNYLPKSVGARAEYKILTLLSGRIKSQNQRIDLSSDFFNRIRKEFDLK